MDSGDRIAVYNRAITIKMYKSLLWLKMKKFKLVMSFSSYIKVGGLYGTFY